MSPLGLDVYLCQDLCEREPVFFSIKADKLSYDQGKKKDRGGRRQWNGGGLGC